MGHCHCLPTLTLNQTHTNQKPPELAGNDDQSSNTDSNSANQGMLEEGRVVTVRDILKGLYEKACQQKLWGLVRHTAGMLGKRVEDLAKAVTDLLVRQKQVRATQTNCTPPSHSRHFIPGHCWHAANK